MGVRVRVGSGAEGKEWVCGVRCECMCSLQAGLTCSRAGRTEEK